MSEKILWKKSTRNKKCFQEKIVNNFYVLIITMIPKKYRLKNRQAFDATYSNRHVVSDSLITVYVGKLKTDPKQQTRFGFVVSKKYSKRAVKRNRIKRLMRECIRLAIKENKLGVCENYMSFILLPKEKAVNTKLCDIQNSFFNLLKRLSARG